MQHLQLQSSIPMAWDTIHFQLKESQTLLAGPSIVTKVLIVLFYLTGGCRVLTVQCNIDLKQGSVRTKAVAA